MFWLSDHFQPCPSRQLAPATQYFLYLLFVVHLPYCTTTLTAICLEFNTHGIDAAQAGFFAKYGECVGQARAGGRLRGGDTNQAEKDGWFLVSLFKQPVESLGYIFETEIALL